MNYELLEVTNTQIIITQFCISTQLSVCFDFDYYNFDVLCLQLVTVPPSGPKIS